MSQKIKSITVIKDFPMNNFQVGKIYMGANLDRLWL